jgi:hypothetical protein
MKKMLGLVVCFNLASTGSGSMFVDLENLWEAAGKKSEKLKLHHQKAEAAPKKDDKPAQEHIDEINESIELVESELKNDKALMAKLLAYLYAMMTPEIKTVFV